MNKLTTTGGRAELRRQARIARTLGSPFVSDLLHAAERQLDRGPATADLVVGWPGDPAAAALGMRLNSALHALARRGKPRHLADLYRGKHDDFDRAVALAFDAEDDFICEWMRYPTQTNEVARTAAIGAALMEIRRMTGLPAELLEIGSSCGLNLNLMRYSFNLGGRAAGDARSSVRIAPTWHGTPPPDVPIEVIKARGVDLRPLDPGDAHTRERLMAYIWPGQVRRSERLERALEVARSFPPMVERANAADWIGKQLAQPHPSGRCRVVLHSMVLQYIGDIDRVRIADAVDAAAARATPERPLARIGFEWAPDRSEVQLTLRCWPDGERRMLATAHPYCDWIAWRGMST